VARAVRPGRFWMRARCRCAALPVLCLLAIYAGYWYWICLIAVRKARSYRSPTA
jgi:hypothetical protein